MTQTFTFSNSNNSKKNSFCFNNSTNYSKILDNIILADIAKKNDYLFKKNENSDIFIANLGKAKYYDDDFMNAVNFITNYKKYNKKYNLPYTLGKMYTLSDGTPIVFYDDEIQIGFDTYAYTNLKNISFLNTLSAPTKKVIINIYANAGTNIDINIL